MTRTSTNTLRVPGAQLHYEVRGSGPVLLLICGGVYDADGYAGLAHQLADRYTVVTYDRRGNSRSPLDGPPAAQSIAVHGDDAHRILTAVGATRTRLLTCSATAPARSSAWSWPPDTQRRSSTSSRTNRRCSRCCPTGTASAP